MTRRCAPAILACAWFAGHATAARADAASAFEDFKAGRYLEAAAEIQAVVDRSPGYAYGYFLLGHCMLKMKETTNAEFQFRRALHIEPRRPEFFEGLAMALNAAGNWQISVRASTEGLALSPDASARFSLLTLRAYAWGMLRRWDAAVADLEAAQQLHSEPWLLVLLGKARFAAGDYANAITPLRRVVQIVPDDRGVLRVLAESYLRLAFGHAMPMKRYDYSQALLYAQRLASLTPNDPDAVNLVGRAALGAGNLDQAESVFRHLLATNPRHCYARTNLGRTYMAASRWAEAEAALRQASACAPRLVAVYESLGELYLRTGRPELAAEAFGRVEAIHGTRRPSGGGTSPTVFSPR